MPPAERLEKLRDLRLRPGVVPAHEDVVVPIFKGVRPTKAPKGAYDSASQKRLWDISVRLAGLEANRKPE